MTQNLTTNHFGSRLKMMFADAIKSENLTQEIVDNWQDPDYSKKNLEFVSFPFLTNVTNVTAKEQKANINHYKRYYIKPYIIFGNTFRLCSQIYSLQFQACETEFKKLSLIAEDAQY